MGRTPPHTAGQPPADLVGRPDLALDARVNEAIRRQQVHRRLSVSGRVRPEEVKGWLFKEVLHADLDDPLLGLGPVLNASYPFAEEDEQAGRR